MTTFPCGAQYQNSLRKILVAAVTQHKEASPCKRFNNPTRKNNVFTRRLSLFCTCSNYSYSIRNVFLVIHIVTIIPDMYIRHLKIKKLCPGPIVYEIQLALS